VPMASVGRIICSCFNVGLNQIVEAASAGCASVDEIGRAVKAGTNCGSCRAEIRGILDAGHLQAAE
jgi:assimilatory nitrate reductase catalytic subunit